MAEKIYGKLAYDLEVGDRVVIGAYSYNVECVFNGLNPLVIRDVVSVSLKDYGNIEFSPLDEVDLQP